MKRICIFFAAVSVLAATPAAARTPPGFFGVVPQGQPTIGDFNRMRGVVETVRLGFTWGQVEPQRGQRDFTMLDAMVGDAAQRGVRVLPVLYGTPSWLTDEIAKPPRGDAARAGWRRFVRAIAARYGPGGRFWRGFPRSLPIRRWQVWNEPNFVLFWRPRPEPRAYARLLRESTGAIRSVDPGAAVIAAGVAPVRGGIDPWRFLRQMYAVPGIKRDFDAVALHPYAATPRGVEIEVNLTRAVMAAAGDERAPLLITEMGVASGPEGARPNAGKNRRQSSFLAESLSMLVARRHRWRIAGVYWFSWRDGPVPAPHCEFCRYSGLFTLDYRPKPAWRAFRRLVTRSQLQS